MDNIVAIAMADAVLVANKNRAQDVKQVVGYLRKKASGRRMIFQRKRDRGAGLSV